MDDANALNDDQKAGMALFFSKRVGCSECHGGFNFSLANKFVGAQQSQSIFLSNGIELNTEAGEFGLFNETQQTEDIGKFRTPSLRNVELTAPYMHDGSLKNLEAVVNHYSKGNVKLGLPVFNLSDKENQQLIAFLYALTDDEF